VLDRLVGRAVLAQADRVVREHVDGTGRYECGHPQRIARVVGEHQEGRVVGQEAAVQREPVADRAHAEFAHAVVDVIGVRIGAGGRLAAGPQRQVRMRQVGRAADQLRQVRRVGLDRHLRRLARGDHGAFGLQLRRVGLGSRGETFRQVALRAAQQLRGQRREGARVALEGLAPLLLASRAGVAGAPALVDFLRDHEGLVLPAQLLARGGQFVLAQRRAMRRLLALLVRRAEADLRAAADQRGLAVSACAVRIACEISTWSWPSTARITCQP
jgi:hypothetical protein